MFVDKAKIHIKAGNGGNGSAAFHREKYVAYGGPDGGDGGKGGSVVFVVDDNLSTLADFRYKRKYVAENGQNGAKNKCFGKKAEDLIIKVPRGTLIKEAESGILMADMSDNEPFIAAKGGNGGWGNTHFATATRQCPRFAKDGAPGDELDVLLELKLLADVGLIGFPNVGKSTFISVVSEAKPKIANYHFTTLIPTLGVVRMGEGESFVIADIPGIIEGASEGIGLGHEFLRHIDRCRMLVHIVDVAGSEGRDPVEDFEIINTELKNYSEELSSRPQIVIANKSDLASEEQIKRFKDYVEKKGYKFLSICAPISEGTNEAINYIAAELSKLPPIVKYESEEMPAFDFSSDKSRDFTVEVHENIYIVDAPWIVPVIQKTDIDDYESLQYFQNVLRKSGIIDALIEKGIQDGDTVSIYDIEFEYVT